MNLDHTQIEVKDIDHLGIIAGIMDEMDLVKIIDELIPPHPLEKISAGVAIKAMVQRLRHPSGTLKPLYSRLFSNCCVSD